MDRVGEWQRRLDEQLPQRIAEYEVPGVSVAVWVDDQMIQSAAGVVNLRTGVPVTTDAVFMIQSITKVWTATLVLQLVDEGLLDLDTPVRTYLPDFRTADEGLSGQITVRHLLTHTGGFEGDIWAPTTADHDALRRFVDDLVPYARQHAEPGTSYSYCNAGCGVLGRLVEVIRGTSYENALRRWLAEPLGIEELAFSADQALAYRTAIGHGRPTAGAALRPLRTWAVLPPSNPAAGNQLAMSARALLAFGRMHLADGVTGDGTRVLSSRSARLMRQPQVRHPAVLGSPSHHGLGWFLPARTGNAEPSVVEHGGDMIGVASLLRLVPERGVAVAVLTNGGNASGLIDAVVSPLLADLAGIEPAPARTPPAAGPVSTSARYLGSYQTRVQANEVTADDDGRLWLTRSPRNEMVTMAEIAGVTAEPERYELRHAYDDTFVLTDASGGYAGTAEFLGADPDGRAELLHTGRAALRSS